ncbi:hypothetical protein HQ585_16440 [candidate division KSB1 bacterium]|nr:hypothetical protein [candidate division KSB1 bacterium]
MTKHLILLFSVIVLSHCDKKEDLSFIDRIQPVPSESGFKMDGYWVWGGSAIKVDSTYHLLASRWPKGHEFPLNYRTDSEIVRATSRSALGPYEFQEIVIGERDSSFWDSNMAHNPTIHKIGDTFVLFYIGSDFSTMHKNGKQLHRCVGYATAKNIKGPWKRSKNPIIAEESNNPAVFVENDGSIKLVYRDAPLRIYLATAPSYDGEYTLVNDNVWSPAKLEDFYIFKRNGSYHIICEDNVGHVSGHVRWGVHLVSMDGIHDWQSFESPVVYTHDIHFEDGRVLECNRRERPQLLIEQRKITHLLTGVYDGENSWCQPVKLNPNY